MSRKKISVSLKQHDKRATAAAATQCKAYLRHLKRNIRVGSSLFLEVHRVEYIVCCPALVIHEKFCRGPYTNVSDLDLFYSLNPDQRRPIPIDLRRLCIPPLHNWVLCIKIFPGILLFRISGRISEKVRYHKAGAEDKMFYSLPFPE